MRKTHLSIAAGAISAALVAAVVTTASAGTGASPCERGQLGVRANGTQGALGTIHGAWVFTNRSDTTCTIDGYPGFHLYGPAGRPIPLTDQDDLTPAPSEVTVDPGTAATFYTAYSDVSSGRKPCPTSAVLQITPPGAVNSLFIPGVLQPCRGEIEVSGVVAGVHHA